MKNDTSSPKGFDFLPDPGKGQGKKKKSQKGKSSSPVMRKSASRPAFDGVDIPSPPPAGTGSGLSGLPELSLDPAGPSRSSRDPGPDFAFFGDEAPSDSSASSIPPRGQEIDEEEARKAAEKTPKKKKRGFLSSVLRMIFFIGTVGVLAGGALGYSLYLSAINDLPSFSRIADYRPPLVTTVLARDGSTIGLLYREKRFLVAQEQMVKYLPSAFLAAEDDAFYQHPGIDFKAIVRAFLSNLASGEKSQGGSTITQQVIKRLMLTPERSYERKLKEAILALQLESRLSKDEILNLYLNQIYLGNNAYGVEAAARTYFAKHASELTLAEAAVLAGLPQAPSSYNPYRNPDAAKQRQRYVLRRMRDLGWISDSDYENAVNQPLVYQSMPEGMGREAGWYLEEVRRQLIDMFSEENSRLLGLDLGVYGEDAVYEYGLTVQTSMDPFQQKTGDLALRKGLEDASKRHGWLGPVDTVSPEQQAEYLARRRFAPSMLADQGWVMALVDKVDKNGADVLLGNGFTGRIAVQTMGWARKPNKKAAGSVTGTYIKDATQLLHSGDVVWASLADAPTPPKGQEPVPFNLTTANPATPIPLRLQQYPDVQGALVSIEPQSGDVVALIGGYAFGSSGSQFNRATQARRQPGSSFKPIVYSASLDNGFTATSMVLDAPLLVINEWTKEVWRPRNFEGGFEGPMTLRRALARSRNLCTVRVVQQIGIGTVIDRAKALGLEPYFPQELAISLGAVAVSPINLTQAYTAFANQGLVSTPRFIQSIQGPWGNPILENPPQHRQAISPENAYIMSSMLSDVVNIGTATRTKVLGRPVAGKTGTTNDENEAWFVGFTPYLVTGIYLGFDQVSPMGRGETGSNAAQPIYVDYAKTALEPYPPDPFPVPPDIVFAQADGTTVPYMPGTQPGTGYGLNALEGSDPTLVDEGEDLLKQLF